MVADVASFLLARFGEEEDLVQQCAAKLTSEGISLVSDLRWVSFQDLRDLKVPLLFARRLHDEGFLSDSSALPRQKRLRPRRFCSGDAIVDLDSCYYSPWPDLQSIVREMENGKWLLLTAPWQSGKTTLLTAVGMELRSRGYLVELTTMDDKMVALANDKTKGERDAAEDFYQRLIAKVCHQSELDPPGNSCEVTDVFLASKSRKPVIWLLDEAQLLNHMYHSTGYAVDNLLSGLRNAKRESVSRNRLGKYRLHSFCLCGLPKLANLIGDARIRRVQESETNYVRDPLRPYLSGWSPPLSKQLDRKAWKLTPEQVTKMLDEYFRDRRMFCKRWFNGDENEEEHRLAIEGIAESIIGITNGHAGLVGRCCDLLQGIGVRSLEQWQLLVDQGRVKHHAFENTVFAKMVMVVAHYPDRVKEVILECMDSDDASAGVDHLDTVMEAINDGVLMRASDASWTVHLSSPLLLAVLIESCSFTQLRVLPAPTQTLELAYESAICLMNPEVFLRPKVLNASGQPSEYIMQSQFFRGLMFMMEQRLYTPHRYRVRVEVKERDESGRRVKRMDGFLESSDAPKQGFELQVGTENARSSIKDHLDRCSYQGKLHGCEMSYLYFWLGEGDPTGARTIIEEVTLEEDDETKMVKVRESFAGITCWYVNFVVDSRAWAIHRLKDNGEWVTSRKAVPTEFPRFLLSSLHRGINLGSKNTKMSFS